MIWFLKKKEAPVVPDNKEVVFLDADGVKWRYKPAKHITAYEVAKLLPVFCLGFLGNIWKYIIDNKLERHFEKVE
jgi:hypothetical protein